MISAPIFSISLFVGMLLFLEIGRRLGIWEMAKDPKGAREGISAVEGSVYGLLGLLVAFTFYGAASRYDERRKLIAEEANAIGTAYLRVDLLPPEVQPAVRENFRKYLDARIAVFHKLPDVQGAMAELARANDLQSEIWKAAIAAKASDPGAQTLLIMESLNRMIDITTTRTMAAESHPPETIYVMLFAFALVSSIFAGYGMASAKRRNWIFNLGFAAVLCVAVFVIVDLEYPRAGLIRLDTFDQVLVDLRNSMT
jgi:hypothetical protein